MIMTSKQIALAVAAVLLIGLGFFLGRVLVSNSNPIKAGAIGTNPVENYIPIIKYNEGYYSELPVTTTAALTSGALSASTGILSGLLTLDAGQLRSYTNATTTGTAVTLKQSDILAYDTVLMTPIVGATTVTFPASSTLTSFVPSAGDMQAQCWVNASSTSAITITFAEGTGINIQVASSTTNLGFPAIQPGGTACFNFVRKTNTDINAAYVRYVDGN